MSDPLLETLRAEEPALRDRAFETLIEGASTAELWRWCQEVLDEAESTENLYQRVRALLYAHALLRLHVVGALRERPCGPLPLPAHEALLERRFDAALRILREEIARAGLDGTLASALAEAAHRAAFQTLADQVRRSVRASRGSQWMFRVGHPSEMPLRVRSELLRRDGPRGLFPVLKESTPVRADLSHAGWSDIFFLGMDFPAGARVINLSVDLGVHARDEKPAPPIETWVRVLPEPLLRLTSIDLGESKDVTSLEELFRFGNDHLGLVKAGVVASGVVPPSFEGTPYALSEVLERFLGPGLGLEVATFVRDIPKGSRLAVSTNLLGSIVAALLRASGQARALSGELEESERRLVAARAILGEWLGGSGGGWQDSGGIWPGSKLIEGVAAEPGDPEYGISRGCLLPRHRVLRAGRELHPALEERLSASLLLFHGGMAQNVGPILELVTERYLLREARATRARSELGALFQEIEAGLREGDVRRIARATDASWRGPLRAILPWIASRYVDRVIERLEAELGEQFWGFQMLGGMAGGGMGIYVAPEAREHARTRLLSILREEKRAHEGGSAFAMEPLVYDWAWNQRGTVAELRRGPAAVFPWRYHALHLPQLARAERAAISPLRRAELLAATAREDGAADAPRLLQAVVARLFGSEGGDASAERARWDAETRELLARAGFDPEQHEEIRRALREGRIGIARNRLPAETSIAPPRAEDLRAIDERHALSGAAALRAGEVAVLTLAGGVGSRWSGGAGVVKAVAPFARLGGAWRSFLELHLAQTRRAARDAGRPIAHLVATSFLTHERIAEHLTRYLAGDPELLVRLSPSRAVAQRFLPMVRDLAALWEESAQELLDAEKQKVRDASRRALMDWARASGEGSDYQDNVPLQRLAPAGHAYELPALLQNGVLTALLAEQPALRTLFVHNVDTLGADLDPAVLGTHRASGAAVSFELVPRRSEDRGGGLARVNGRPRLVEALALPREELELELPWYSSMSAWIEIDPFLALFDLDRARLAALPRRAIDARVRAVMQRLPTYVAIKDAIRRWGHAQEDVFPVAQWERLFGDFSALPDLRCAYLAVPRPRGQQLKDPGLLDLYAQDGSLGYAEARAEFAIEAS